MSLSERKGARQRGRVHGTSILPPKERPRYRPEVEESRVGDLERFYPRATNTDTSNPLVHVVGGTWGSVDRMLTRGGWRDE